MFPCVLVSSWREESKSRVLPPAFLVEITWQQWLWRTWQPNFPLKFSRLLKTYLAKLLRNYNIIIICGGRVCSLGCIIVIRSNSVQVSKNGNFKLSLTDSSACLNFGMAEPVRKQLLDPSFKLSLTDSSACLGKTSVVRNPECYDKYPIYCIMNYYIIQ